MKSPIGMAANICRIFFVATSSLGIANSSYTNLMFLSVFNSGNCSSIALIKVLFTDGEYLFVDPDNKLSKYAPKNWRSSHAHVSVEGFQFCFSNTTI